MTGLLDRAEAATPLRPDDILQTRRGLTVAIANTDCEDRPVLADALAFADEEAPDPLVDAATLTGSARVALGGEVGALFSSDPAPAADLQRPSLATGDPLSTLPLWAPCGSGIAAPGGDLLNMAGGPDAGAITAALFLKAFVEKSRTWIHLDVGAWNDRVRPGRPVGGEATGTRAVFALAAERFPPSGRPGRQAQGREG